MKLLLRRLVILFTLIAYIIFVAWLEKSSNPFAKLIWETGSDSRLQFSNHKYINKNDILETWLEPKSFLSSNSTKVNIQDGMYYIVKHSKYVTTDITKRSSGLIKVYHSHVPSTAPSKKTASKKISNPWNLLFIDRLPGHIISSSFDKSREIDSKTNATSPRRLGFLFKLYSEESSSYYVRIYNIDSNIKPLSDKDMENSILKLESYDESSVQISDIANSKVCSSDIMSDKIDHDLILTDPNFKSCVAKSNSHFEYLDYELPGNTEITGFAIKDDKIVYSRNGDTFYFRITRTNTKSDLNKLKSTVGSYIKPGTEEFNKQLKLIILPTNRGSNLDILASEGWLESYNFKFKVSLFQNFTQIFDSDKKIPDIKKSMLLPEKEEWATDRLVQYILRVGKGYNSLNEFEKGLITRLPITEQASRTTVCYFYISQVVLTIDTSWEVDSLGNNIQHQKLSSTVLANSNLSNDAETTGIYLDDSGKILVISKLNGDLLIFGRKANILSPNSSEKSSNGDGTTKFAIPQYNPKKSTDDSMKSKSIPKRLSENLITFYTWKLLMQWSPPEYLDVWSDNDNQLDQNIFFGHGKYLDNLIHNQPLNINKKPIQSALNSPSAYGEYFIALRVFLIDGNNELNLNKNEEVYKTSNDDFSRLKKITLFNTTNTKIRIIAIKYDGTTKYLSLDDFLINDNWIISYLTSHFEVLVPVLIVTLLFAHYESRYH
ncbi:hypothetical protein BB561_002103 [Smittium simulii]|uniref:Uncharacterized protein n=1 Tax=Smittium simulii TaxID=133385 RepID=A0A2T9YRL7_9FUNG|nr:hypothetical protein BB561_002103 [Smittium simulii]